MQFSRSGGCTNQRLPQLDVRKARQRPLPCPPVPHHAAPFVRTPSCLSLPVASPRCCLQAMLGINEPIEYTASSIVTPQL